MDRDRVEGAGKKMAGGMKEAAGKMTGDRRLEAEGKVEKTAGKVQDAFGKAKDDIRNRERDRDRRS